MTDDERATTNPSVASSKLVVGDDERAWRDAASITDRLAAKRPTLKVAGPCLACDAKDAEIAALKARHDAELPLVNEAVRRQAQEALGPTYRYAVEHGNPGESFGVVEVNRAREALEYWIARASGRDAEIARLRAALREMIDALPCPSGACLGLPDGEFCIHIRAGAALAGREDADG